MNAANREECLVRDAADMEAQGARLAKRLSESSNVYLYGDLGVGKTTFCRGVLRALGHADAVKSPTFGLLETYEPGGLTVMHMDLYRLNGPAEMAGYGLLDCFNETAIVLLEWPERAGNAIPPADFSVRLDYAPDGRTLTIETP